jgi:hypothetical protein
LVATLLRDNQRGDWEYILKAGKATATINHDPGYEEFKDENRICPSPIPNLLKEIIAQQGLFMFLSNCSLAVEMSDDVSDDASEDTIRDIILTLDNVAQQTRQR